MASGDLTGCWIRGRGSCSLGRICKHPRARAEKENRRMLHLIKEVARILVTQTKRLARDVIKKVFYALIDKPLPPPLHFLDSALRERWIRNQF